MIYTVLMKEIIVPSKYDGKKLNTFLLDTFDGLSLNLLYKTLRKKDIRVNDVKVSENVTIYTNDHIKVFLLEEQLYKTNVIDIVYEDANIVVVNKPTCMEVVGEHSLTSILQELYKQSTNNTFSNNRNTSSATPNFTIINPCHRLDRNTTGLVLFAKNNETLSILLDKFKSREIEKLYRAQVYGIPKIKEQLLKAYLFKDNKKSFVYISDTPKKGYVPIQTYYKVLECNKNQNTCLLEINLLTGKTHQIRSHLAHIGFPIIGDGKYGNNEINKKFGCKFQKLCSYSIGFKFTSPSGILEYLNGKVITLKNFDY